MQKLEDVRILMKNVEFILGNENITNTPLKTFSDETIEFFFELSDSILKSPYSRQFPDLSALAFWCRKGNIKKLKEEYDNTYRIGRGLCFHIAPSNIPVNFAFSYFFSLLAGNSNIVRLPSKNFPQNSAFIEIVKNILPKYKEIEKRTAFIKYDRNNEITEEFSLKADCRMIWGGIKTIEIVKSLKSNQRCIDITFPDRYSVCLINLKAIQEADDASLKKLSENFYNDTYLMDQNACSSPQLIYYINPDENSKQKFWNAVYNRAKEKYNLPSSVSVDKYTKLCENAIEYKDYIYSAQHNDNLLYRIKLSKIDNNMDEIRAKCGYFYEYDLENINDFYKIVNEKYQTVTYFGIDPKNIVQSVINNKLRGIDRIVPIGKAMDINAKWDGHDLIKELSREIIIN